MSNIIKTTQLTRRFGGLTAVDNLELAVPRGSVYGFLGPNGAGKTTTIRMLLGLIRPNAGEVHLFRQSIREERLGILKRVGSLVEKPSLYPHLTGRENLEVIRRLRNLEKPEIEHALKTVGMLKAADRLVKGYSTGMKQRLGLAIALLGQPELLILDEPTNGLDPSGIHEMRDLLCRLPGEKGITVFLSSHLLNEVEQMATQIGIIQQGRLIFQGTQDDLQSQLHEVVSLQVDLPEEARKVLVESGWQVTRNGNRRLVVTANGSSDAAILNTQLMEAGIKVYHLSLERPSLEDIFLKLTEAG